MRNLRKLTAVVIAIALVLTSMASVFAAATPANADKAATLKDLGLYAGKDATNPAVGLEDALQVQQSLVYLANMFGYKADADKMTDGEATKALAKFADGDKIADYAKKVVAYSAANGIIAGTKTNDGKLYVKPTATVTAARFATFIINGMGYELEGSYTEAVAQLAEINGNKIDAAAAGDLTRDAAVGMMYGALTAKTAAGKTVVENLVAANASLKAVAEKAGLIVSSALEVTGVTATNLRELVIAYNKAVPNADEAKKKENYKIGSNNPQAVTLSDDNKTVTIRTANANAMGNYSTVDLTILKAVGFDADKVIKGIAVKDTTVPSAVSVKTTGPKTIKVTLSEPLKEDVVVDVNKSIKVDAGLVAIDTANTTVSGLELTIKTYSNLSEGAHKVDFTADTSYVDNAGYKLQASTLTFDYVKDTSPLAIEVVEQNETSVTIKFNKTVNTDWLTKNEVEFSHTYNGSNKIVANEAGAVTSTDGQKFVINFGTSKPFPPGPTTVFIKNADKIVDDYGNKLTVTSFAVNTKADTVKPTVSSVEFKNYDEVEVTYSEAVETASAQNVGNYTLKSGSDVVNITSATQKADDKKVVTLKTATMNGGSYTLTVKKVIDTSIAKNEIDEVTVTFTGTDKVAPEVKSVKFVSDKKIKVTFSEAMDVASITDKTVYKLGATKLQSDDTVEAVDSNKAVIITFKTVPAGSTLHIARVKDVAGNWGDFYDYPATIAALTTIGLKEYQVIGKNQIKLVIEDSLKNMNAEDFNYKANASEAWTTPAGLSVSIVDGVTYITLTTKTDIQSTTGAGVAVTTVGDTKTENEFGTKLSFTATSGAVDKYAPAMKSTSLTTKAGKKSGTQVATVTITYSEALYAASVQESDFTVAGYEIDSVSVSADRTQVVITVKDVDYASYSSTDGVKVKQVGEIQDAVKNVSGAQDEWTVK